MSSYGRQDINVLIQNASPRAIYAQIEDQIRSQALDGTLAEGEQLPSIRQLAAELRVSVITVKRAYDDLEAEGILQTVAGRGSFVAVRNQNAFRERKMTEIENLLERAIEAAKLARIDPRDVRTALDILIEEESIGNSN